MQYVLACSVSTYSLLMVTHVGARAYGDWQRPWTGGALPNTRKRILRKIYGMLSVF